MLCQRFFLLHFYSRQLHKIERGSKMDLSKTRNLSDPGWIISLPNAKNYRTSINWWPRSFGAFVPSFDNGTLFSTYWHTGMHTVGGLYSVSSLHAYILGNFGGWQLPGMAYDGPSLEWCTWTMWPVAYPTQDQHNPCECKHGGTRLTTLPHYGKVNLVFQWICLA